MYLKVEIEGEEEFFSFENKNTVTIGRAPESDIQLLTEGISRLHLVVREREGEFFFEDLGSTNGTFLNEERVAANTEEPFNSFFPIKLGFNVFLYLVDEASAQVMREEVLRKQEQAEEKKRQELVERRKKKSLEDRVYVPKNKGGQDVTGRTKVVKRKKIAVKSANAKKKRQSFGNLPLVIAGLLIVVGAYFYKNWRKSFFEKNKAANVAVKTEPVKAKKAPAAKVFGPVEAAGFITFDKCFGEFEKKLCGPLEKGRNRGYYEGFLKMGSILYFTIDMENIEKTYTKKVYTEEEKKYALSLLARFLGRKFSRQEIIANDFRYQPLELKGQLAKKSAVITDLAVFGLAQGIVSNEEVKDFYLILYKGSTNSYLAHTKLDKEALAKIAESKDLPKQAKVYWRSGLEQPMRSFIKGLGGIKLQGLQKLD